MLPHHELPFHAFSIWILQRIVVQKHKIDSLLLLITSEWIIVDYLTQGINKNMYQRIHTGST